MAHSTYEQKALRSGPRREPVILCEIGIARSIWTLAFRILKAYVE